MNDAVAKATAEALRRWYKQDKVVPIERAFAYRQEKPAPRPNPPSGGPGRAA
jgi:hypothetical protein